MKTTDSALGAELHRLFKRALDPSDLTMGKTTGQLPLRVDVTRWRCKVAIPVHKLTTPCPYGGVRSKEYTRSMVNEPNCAQLNGLITNEWVQTRILCQTGSEQQLQQK